MKKRIRKFLYHFIFIALCGGFVFFATRVYDSYRYGLYSGCENYQESKVFKERMFNDLNNICEIVVYHNVGNVINYDANRTNFRFSIYLDDGTFFIGNSQDRYANVLRQLIHDPAMGDVTANIYYRVDDHYSIDDDYAREAKQFGNLYRNRLLNSTSAFALLAGILTIAKLIISTDKKELSSRKPRFIDQIPLDLLLLGDLGVVLGCFQTLSVSKNSATLNTIFKDAILVLIAFFLLRLVDTMSVRISEHDWFKNTLIYKLTAMAPDFLQNLPYILKYIGAALLILVIIPLILISIHPRSGIYWYLAYALLLWIICGYEFAAINKIRRKNKELIRGKYDEKLNDDAFYGMTKALADDANQIAEGLTEALEKNISAERLKIELITNVSHDLKTPLTSLLSYIDLLKREEDKTRQKEYIEILDRQSQRLKKITDDVFEMSKLSSGNITLEISDVDLSELLIQALGEYQDKMVAKNLDLVSNISEHLISACDGRHTWRVIDNCLNNVCKYAKEHTRVYIDADQDEESCYIVIKNISDQQLNISADSLMERFVRGDHSRNSEGSGLGLNIAKSLTELQGGRFSISIDGDLFKLKIILPKKSTPSASHLS